MAGFGAKPVIQQPPGFGAKPVLIQQPGFGAKPVIWQSPGFGAECVIIQPPGFGAECILPTGCFPKLELIRVDIDTYVPIGSLKIGDKIRTWDQDHEKELCSTVTKIHTYTVTEIICFNNTMRVSSTHPIMTMHRKKFGSFTPIWKIAYDINIGDFIVGINGRLIKITTKNSYWYDAGTTVLNLSTACGLPFVVRNCVVRAENATDKIYWSDTPITQELVA